MPKADPLTPEQAEELQQFRRNLEAADLPDVCGVVAGILDSHVDLLRELGAAVHVVEMAVSAANEMRVRRRHLEQPSRMLGHA